MREILLPYYNDRRGRDVKTLVIHASAQHTADALIAKLVERELSAHYLVDEHGVLVIAPTEMMLASGNFNQKGLSVY